MRSLSFVIVLAACSSRSQPPSSETATAQPAASTPTLGLAMLVPDDATTVSVWRPMELAILSMIDSQPEMYRCWRDLEQKIEVAYQVFTADQSSFVILEGDLSRAQVQPCAEEALGYSRILTEDFRDEGGQLVVQTALGLVHAGWRDRFVVIGRPSDVTRSLASQTPSKVWAAAIDDLPGKDALATTAFAAISRDLMFTGIVGVPTTRWTMVFDGPPRGWPTKTFIEDGEDALDRFVQEQLRLAKRKEQGLPPEPPESPDAAVPPEPERRMPTFRGRIELHYASTADAKRASEIFTKHAFSFELETNLALALSRLPQKLAGTKLTVEFTHDSFPGVELDKLQAWLASVQAAASAQRPN